MPIKGYNTPAIVFLTELQQQIMLAQRAANHLLTETEGWRKSATGEQSLYVPSPLDILEWCTNFLAACAAIQRLLLPGKRAQRKNDPGAIRAVQRCEALRQLLEIEELPYLQQVEVRNSWEHMDERLDDRFKTFTAGSITQVSVAEQDSDSDSDMATYLMRRYDPARHVILTQNGEIRLAPCLGELQDLYRRIDERAYPKLRAGRVDLWK